MSGAAVEIVGLTMSAALLMAGAVAALTSGSVAKRLAAALVAVIAALIALAALGAPQTAVTGGVVVGFGYCVVGVSLLVRLQESYGANETAEIDAADATSEPPEQGA